MRARMEIFQKTGAPVLLLNLGKPACTRALKRIQRMRFLIMVIAGRVQVELTGSGRKGGDLGSELRP